MTQGTAYGQCRQHCGWFMMNDEGLEHGNAHQHESHGAEDDSATTACQQGGATTFWANILGVITTEAGCEQPRGRCLSSLHEHVTGLYANAC